MRYLMKFESFKLENDEKELLDYILHGDVNESVSDTLDRFKKIWKKGLLTASLLTTLLSNPAFASEYEKIDSVTKNQIEKSISKTKEPIINFKSNDYIINDEISNYVMKYVDDLLKIDDGKSNFIITIVASESKVTNKGFGVGELSKKRADELNKFISNYLSKINKENITIRTSILIGDEKYDRSVDDKDAEKYKSEQYVKLKIEKNNCPLCEIAKIKNGKEADKSDDYIGFTKPMKFSSVSSVVNCELIPESIPDRLVIKLDDKVIGDTGYFASESEYKPFKYVPKYILELSQKYDPKMDAFKSSDLSKIDIRSFASFDDLLKVLMNDGFEYDEDYNQSQPSEISEPLKKLADMFKNGKIVRLVFYRIGDGKFTINKKDHKGTILVETVYSPIGKTGFKIKNICK